MRQGDKQQPADGGEYPAHRVRFYQPGGDQALFLLGGVQRDHRKRLQSVRQYLCGGGGYPGEDRHCKAQRRDRGNRGTGAGAAG